MQFLTEDNGEIKRIGDGELRQFSFLFFSKRFFSFLSEIGAWALGADRGLRHVRGEKKIAEVGERRKLSRSRTKIVWQTGQTLPSSYSREVKIKGRT